MRVQYIQPYNMSSIVKTNLINCPCEICREAFCKNGHKMYISGGLTSDGEMYVYCSHCSLMVTLRVPKYVAEKQTNRYAQVIADRITRGEIPIG